MRRLVDEHVRESDDLDFKREHYGRNDKAKVGLATDVAAFANDRGGVIVLGIDDEQEVASELTQVRLDGESQRWVREVVARHTAPHVSFDLLAIPSDAEPTVGWLLIVVPPSPRRPHAVANGDNLRYSRRHGTTNRHLSDAEVADLYRDRYAVARTDLDRVATIMREGLSTLESPSPAVLAAALLPAAPGRMSIDGPRLQRIKDWLTGSGDGAIGHARFWLGFFEGTPTVFTGHRRVVASSAYEPPNRPPHCELHIDGGGFAACRLSDNQLRVHGGEDAGYSIYLSSVITVAIARLLRLLGRHACDHAGAYGDSLLVLRLLSDKPFKLGYLHEGLPSPIPAPYATMSGVPSTPSPSMHLWGTIAIY